MFIVFVEDRRVYPIRESGVQFILTVLLGKGYFNFVFSLVAVVFDAGNNWLAASHLGLEVVVIQKTSVAVYA